MVIPPAPPRPPSLDHFAIFNPSKRKTKATVRDAGAEPSSSSKLDDSSETSGLENHTASDHGESAATFGSPELDAVADSQPSAKDLDLEDDLREASQILFYSSRNGSVSRDTMLRQVGLARGLMGFTDMVTKEASGKTEGDRPTDHWSFRSHRSRMIVYSPEPDLYLYANITLSTILPQVTEPRTRVKSSHDAKTSALSSKYEPAPGAQGLSDELLVRGLKRGFHEFQLLHGSFSDIDSSASSFEKYWTRFTHEYESNYLCPANPLEMMIDGTWSLPGATVTKVHEAFQMFDFTSSLHHLGVVSPIGSYCSSPVDPSLIRYLSKILHLSLPSLPPTQDNQGTKTEDRKSSWSTLGLSWVPTLSMSRSVTPSKASTGNSRPTSENTKPMLRVQPSKQSLISGPSQRTSMESPTTPQLGQTGPNTTRAVPPGTETATVTQEKEDKWGFGLGLGGLTDAMGSLKAPGLDMGHLFRFGTPPGSSGEVQTATEASVGARTTQDGVSTSTTGEQVGIASHTVDLHDPLDIHSRPDNDPGAVRSSLEVDPRPGLVPDLAAASSHEIDLGWSSRTVYLWSDQGAGSEAETKRTTPEARTPILHSGELQESEGGDGSNSTKAELSTDSERVPRSLKRYTVSWIIRDTILLFLLSPAHPDPSISPAQPSSEQILSLYSTLSAIFTSQPSKQSRSSSDHSSTSWTYSSAFSSSRSPTPISKSSQDILVGLNSLSGSEHMDEVYAKTSSDFVASKRLEPSSRADHNDAPDRPVVFLSLGRKDASLTDADHAMRAFLRSHPHLEG